MSVVVGHDCIHANVSHLPPGQSAGYTTGSPDIKWTAPDWHAHPGAVRICQDSGTDHTADCLDVESGAAANGQAAGWFKAALAAYHAAARPGQRSPAIYTSASNVTPLVNALLAGGVKTGVALWVANWNLSDAQATADVQNAAGPFPIVGVQFHSGATYDTNVFSGTWLARVSQPAAPVPHRHLTAAGDTVASLASSRRMHPDSWLALQAKLGANVAALASGPLPAGTEWRSVNP
jgi:hypothetical protein